MPGKKKSGHRAEPEIPTASMADIAFLLIIFFLVTTSFNQEMGLSLTLPPVSDQAEQIQVRQKNIVNIWINAVGEILLGDEIVSLQQIEPEIRRRLNENPLLIVSLKTDRDTDYNDFIQVLDQLKKSGASKISLAEPD
jgi:biopolymer transport protein ExbD